MASAEKLAAVKLQLDSYLRSNNVYDKIRSLLTEQLGEGDASQEQVMTALQEKGPLPSP